MESSQYTVLKQCRVQLADRSVVELRPGDDVPSDAVIGNPHAWLNHGYIRRKDNLPDPASHAAHIPSREADLEDATRSVSRPPAPGEEIRAPLGGDGNVRPAETQQVSREQLMELTKSDLADLANDAGIDVNPRWTKDQIVSTILGTDAG